MITAKQLTDITPITTARIETFLPHLVRFMPMYEIDGKLREAAFLATILHESGRFRYVREIASGRAYEGRKDLGNTVKGDGMRYKGRGLIQITGRFNYRQLGKALSQDFEGNPELLATPTYAVQSACWWWHDRDLNEVADTPDFRRCTRIVNGAYNGWEDRIKLYKSALLVL